MKKIQLTQNKYALVDNEDYEELNKFNWYFRKSSNSIFHSYAARRDRKLDKIFRMHRIITNCPDSLQVDHINGDTLDNRKENLRICNQFQNSGNSKLSKRNTSGIKGVSFDKKRKTWVAQIRITGRVKYLGTFSDSNDARNSYEKAAKQYFGEFYSDGIQKENKNLIKEVNNIETIKKERLYINNVSGIKGVSWYKSNKKWLANINIKNKTKFLGYYDCIADAKAAYDVAKLGVL